MDESVGIAEQIAAAVMAWPGVERAAHRFGGIEFRLGKRELGHLHGDALVDLPFPRKVRDELVAQGRARPHRAPRLRLGELLDRVAGRRRMRDRALPPRVRARGRGPRSSRSGIALSARRSSGYLDGERRLARMATVGRDGTPNIVPVVMWSYNPLWASEALRQHSTSKGRPAPTSRRRDGLRLASRHGLAARPLVSLTDRQYFLPTPGLGTPDAAPASCVS